MRHLASIRKILALDPIEGADAILVATIDGWKVVVKKDEFKVGDYCVYCEVDSFLPDGHIAWQHLVDKSSRTFEGVKGHRLKTIKLRGQLSQGFAAPIDKFFDDFIDSKWDEGQELTEFFWLEGNDLTEMLKIKKYEKPIPAELAGQMNGDFPTFIKKTEQERCQNLVHEIFDENRQSVFEVTIKMDGSSFTAFYVDKEEGVCSRNWELKVDESNETNTFVRLYLDSGLQEVLRKYGKNIAVQGELMGPGIQKNREGLTKHTLFVFNIYDIDAGDYLPFNERYATLYELYALGLNTELVQHAPVKFTDFSLDEHGIETVDQLLAFAEGPSLNHPVREGYVFKRKDGKFGFKVISNKFLLKEEE